eukprot:7981494-Heterocapsa_arctica.AAC.2
MGTRVELARQALACLERTERFARELEVCDQEGTYIYGQQMAVLGQGCLEQWQVAGPPAPVGVGEGPVNLGPGRAQ